MLWVDIARCHPVFIPSPAPLNAILGFSHHPLTVSAGINAREAQMLDNIDSLVFVLAWNQRRPRF